MAISICPRPHLRVWHSTRVSTMFSGIVRAVCIIVLVVELILACQPPDCDDVDCGSCGMYVFTNNNNYYFIVFTFYRNCMLYD